MIKKILRRMVGVLSLTGMLILAGSAVMPISTEAAEHSGTFGENDGLSWSYDEETKTVIITGEDEVKETYAYATKIAQFPEWQQMDIEINKIEFQDCKIKGSVSYAFSNSSDLNNSFLEIDLSGLNTSQITDMGNMFSGCSSLTSLDLSNFDTSQVTSMWCMFSGCDNLTSLDLSNFNTSQVMYMHSMFSGCSSLTSLDLSNFNTSQVTNMNAMFSNCSSLTSLDLSNLNTSQVTNMGLMFSGCSSLTSLNLNNLDTSQVTNMEHMFSYCNSLTSLNLSNFNTSQVIDMSAMFYNCKNLNSLSINCFDTSQVTDMYYMFYKCNSLSSLDLSNFDTSQVTNMNYMFFECTSLSSLDLSNFDTSQVTNMDHMFYSCDSLSALDLSNFDTSQVTNMESMFLACKNLTSLDISSFNTSQVRIWNSYFDMCNNLQTIKTPQILAEEQSISLPGVYYDTVAYEKGEYIETKYINASYAGKFLKRASDLNSDTNNNIGTGDNTNNETTIIPSDANGWYTIDGKDYWYENGVRQGTEGRGKEIYDPVSNAWYWLDAVQDGAKATDKDVYQESSGGKWVRYDAEGRMIKGEDYRYGGWYYFEPITGTMIKGPAVLSDGRKVFYDTVTGQMVKGSITINGQTYTFDENTGELLSGAEGFFWLNIDGKDYWYENWTRQGWDTSNEAYRGKEIYDPVSDAWYWLDNVQQGAKAVSKDVYQESQADDAGNIGKWVRYDENGHMIKGWNTNENGTYYFDLIYGTMLKGEQLIEGSTYFFDENTGILQK